jgi:C1A family cysteine protease
MVRVAVCLSFGLVSAETKRYSRGFVRQPRDANAVVEVADITQAMRDAAPAKLDWSEKGATTPVKDQGDCGSCWAFSATEGIESGVFMATGQLPVLSTQQIISCDKTDGGCDGGDLPTAFAYVEKAGGIDSASDYPDKSHQSGHQGSCTWDKQKVAQVSNWKYAIPSCDSGACKNQDEDGLKAALNTYGPLSVCVNAESWDDYSSGVYTKKCSGAAGNLDHCVQLVGYDTTASTPYWKVRNSWAADWGEKGFIRLPMGKNACGIADEATYVIAKEATVEDLTV